MQHRLMIIGSSFENIELVKMSKSRGYYTVVCDGYPNGPAKKFADKAYTIDVRKPHDIADLCKEEQVDGIIGSFSDLLYEQITKIATYADLRWYAEKSQIKYYRKKNVVKSVLKEIGAKVPHNKVIAKDFKDEELDNFTWPVVIKPINGWGSKGIYVVNSIDEVRDRFDKVLKYSLFDEEEEDTNMIQVEEYCYGREYNMITWICDGEAHLISIADREKNPREGYTVPLLNRIAYPSKNTESLAEEALDIVKRYIKVSGQKDGPVCVQFFYDGQDIVICEVAARVFGYEHEMVEWCSGLSIEKILLDYVYEPEQVKEALAKHNPVFDKNYAGIYFIGRQGAVLADQTAFKDMVASERLKGHIEQYIPYYNEGETIDNYGPHSYFTSLFIKADSREELDEITEYIFKNASATADDGTELLIPFVLETD